MLAIKRQSKAFRAIAAGSLAFAVGLTSVAAYVGSTLEHQNLVFSKEQTVNKPEGGTTGDVVLDAQQEGTVTTTNPQAEAMPWVAGSSTSTVPAVSAPATTASVTAGSSTDAGVSVATPTPAPEPVVTLPATPTPGGVDAGLELCVNLLPAVLPVIGVNCRAN